MSLLRFLCGYLGVAALLWVGDVSASGPDLASSPSPQRHPDGRSEIALVSWRSGTAYLFTLLPREEFDSLAERIFEPITPQLSKLHVILTVSELESQIARTPKGSRISWMDFPPEAIRVGYPPRDVRDRIIEFAATHGIDLQLSPAIYDR
jgi:hypothetical protein